MKLIELLKKCSYECIKGNVEVEISDIVYDSREAGPGVVFVCTDGANADGHQYISQAVKQGAIAVIIEKDVTVGEDICVIKVDSSRKTLSFLSAAYFHNPANDLITIGLTGTKGKTTTSYMIKEVLQRVGKKVGLIGTIGAMIGEEKISIKNTTPESYEIQKLFRQMADNGCEYVIMEVSSQGLKQERVAGIDFDYGAFTNFSQDHIGPTEHVDMEEYLMCKSLLFRQCKCGIINRDDEKWEGVLKGHTCEVKTFGCHADSDLLAEDIEFIREKGKLGMRFHTKGCVESNVLLYIPGRFSVYNALLTMMVCYELNIDTQNILTALKEVKVKGRVEIVPVSDHFTVLVDYAHNEASTRSILNTLREYRPYRIICIYGGGGDRPKLRRYDMGEVTGELADLSILTTDNPRFEEVEDIIEDIKVGLHKSNGNYIVILDRKEAITYAIEHAREDDMILLLGKGHENYQDIKGVRVPYDERKTIMEVINNKKKV